MLCIHLQRDIENLKKRILNLGARVEKSVRQATLSIENKDVDLANEVINNDIVIDESEVEVEEECLKILALHQPVAIDLRFIIAVLKINNDLERIGDLAVNIAERSVYLCKQPPVDISINFADMSDFAQSMLKESLDALVNFSVITAQNVRTRDDIIDAMNRDMYIKISNALKQNPTQIGSLIHLLSVSRHLERIADHATNIAEDVIYMIQGQIVRHKPEDYR
jgi:phosphate transport system protein